MSDSPPKRWNWIATAKLVAGITLLAIVFTSVGLERFVEAIRDADRGLVALAFLCFLMISFLEGGKLFAAFRNLSVELGACVRMVFAGVFFSNFLPSILGADVYKVYVLHRSKREAAAGLALVSGLRLLSLGLSAVIAGAYVLFRYEKLVALIRENPLEFSPNYMLIAAAVAVVLVLGVVAVAATSKRFAKIRSGLPELWKRASGALKALRGGQLVAILFFTVGVIAMRAFSNQYLLFSLGEDLPLFEIFFVTTVVTLISVFPLTFASLGVREGATTILLVLFGVGVGVAAGIAILNRLFLWLVSLVGGLTVILDRKATKEASLPSEEAV